MERKMKSFTVVFSLCEKIVYFRYLHIFGKVGINPLISQIYMLTFLFYFLILTLTAQSRHYKNQPSWRNSSRCVLSHQKYMLSEHLKRKRKYAFKMFSIFMSIDY